MIIQSGNDATIALAERIAGSEAAFVQMMIGYAQRLACAAPTLRTRAACQARTTTARHATLRPCRARLSGNFRSTTALRNQGIHLEQHTPGKPQRSARARSDRRWHQDRPHGHGWLLPDQLCTSFRHAPDFRGAGLTQRAGARIRSAALLNYGFNFYESVPVKKAGEMVLKPARLQRFRAIHCPGPIQRRAGDRAARPGRHGHRAYRCASAL